MCSTPTFHIIDALPTPAVLIKVPTESATATIRFVNVAFCDATGWLPRDLVGQPVSSIWGGAFPEEKASEAEEIDDRDVSLTTRGAERTRTINRWRIARVEESDTDGSLYLCVSYNDGATADSTADVHQLRDQIRQIEQARQLSDTLLAEIMRVAADAIVVVDEDQRIIEFNRGAEAMFGYARSDAVGHQMDFLLPEHARAGHPDHVRKFGAAAPPARLMSERGEIAGQRRNGEVFPCQASIARIEDGDTVLYAAILRDQTERKRIDSELHQALDRAEAANEAKSRFLATVSHELRSPLNAIIGFSEVMATGLLGPIDNPDYRGYAHDIHMSGKHLLEIIEGIMDISLIDSGRSAKSLTDVPLRDAVTDAAAILRPLATAESLRLVFDVPENIVLFADHKMLRQILLNLIGNSIKFSDKAGDIVIAAAREADGSVRLTVRDCGIGIPEDKLDAVAEPFFQVDDSNARKHQGIGLGLSLVKRFAELHGGTFRIANNRDRGTTATVVLPDAHPTR